MLSFDASTFAIAGAIAAAGPIIIHLLNRRRFRVVDWAAMDFLREALERNRRVMHFRDILLLALRVLAMVLIGLVLARPFFKGSAAGALWHAVLLAFCLVVAFGGAIALVTSGRSAGRGRMVAGGVCLAGLAGSVIGLLGIARQASQGDTAASVRAPVHAIVLVDNSRSMGVEALGGTLLDRAKAKAAEFIDSLPPESRMTIIPLAGSEDQSFTLNAYPNKDDAKRQLERIQRVDTEGAVRPGLGLAEQAGEQVPDLAAKRVVLITDLQASAWQSGIAPDQLQRLSGMQIVDIATSAASNVWVAGFRLEDGLASAEVPCRLLARLEASGAEGGEPFEVQARLLIDNSEVASQAVTLTPGQSREIEFLHQFDVLADPLKPGSATATLVVQSELQSADLLPSDNRQQIVVPVVASLPVVFIDQYGDEENLEKNRIGETYALRHLMAPRASSDRSQRRLIHVEHVRPDQVGQELLETARLVVLAGVESPDEALVSLLREYVVQGGPLVLLAGGHFDPVAWQERAWRAGQGILPAPLEAKSLGVTPEEAPQNVQPFFADFTSMQHDYFLVDGEEPAALASLFEATAFFKALQADLGTAAADALVAAETERYRSEKAFLDQYADRASARAADRRPASPEDAERDHRYRQMEPAWWTWRSPLPLVDRSLPAEELARKSVPRVLASFDRNRAPFVIERSIGAGRVVLFTSGVTSNWNLLRGSGAMYLFHRTFCQLMEQTLPRRTFEAGQKITIPIERRSDLRLALTRPSGVREPLPLEAIGADVSGVMIRRPVVAGTYVVEAEQSDSGAAASTSSIDEIPLAVNGAVAESNLTTIRAADLQQQLGHDHVRVLSADEPIRVEGGTRRGQDLWKLLAWSVLACLLLEQLVMAWPMLGKRKTS